jgi:N-acetylmuramoyl-L-alanine amidase
VSGRYFLCEEFDSLIPFVFGEFNMANEMNDRYLQVMTDPQQNTIAVSPMSNEILSAEQPVPGQVILASAPILSAIEPALGALNGGAMVKIQGQNFVSGCQVKFGGVNATQITFNSSESLTVVTPPFATADLVDVQVMNPDGQTGQLTKAFQYTEAETRAAKFKNAQVLNATPNIVTDSGDVIGGVVDAISNPTTIRAGQSIRLFAFYERYQFGRPAYDLVDPLPSGFPPASQVTFSPNPCPTFQDIFVDINTSLNTPPGVYVLRNGGRSRFDGALYPVASFSLTIQSPATVSLTPVQPMASSVNGSSATYRFRINRDGYQGAVGLSIRGNGFNFTTSNAGFTNGSEIAVEVFPAAGTPPGNYTLTVDPQLQEGQRSDVRQSGTSVTIQVGSVSVVASPNSQEVQVGGRATYNLQINRNNFSGNVEFREVLGLPSGVRVMPNSTVNPTQITITTDSSNPQSGFVEVQPSPGRSNLTIRLRAILENNQESLLETRAEIVIVPRASVRLLADPTLRDIRPGDSSEYAITIMREGFNGPVRLSTQPQLSGIIAELLPPETSGLVSNLKITVPPGSPTGGPITLTVKGTILPTGSQGLDASPNLVFNPPVLFEDAVVNFRIADPPGLRLNIQVRNNLLANDPVKECKVELKGTVMLQGTTNNLGNVTLSSPGGVPDGMYQMIFTPKDNTSEPVGPDIASTLPRPDRIWRTLESTVELRSNQVIRANPGITVNTNGSLLAKIQPVWMRSPNVRSSRSPKVNTLCILHFTGAPTITSTLNAFLEPGGLSSHYVVDTDGQVVKMVHESDISFHAGESHWAGEDNVNAFSVGIEQVHVGGGTYPGAQINGTIELLKRIRNAVPTIPAEGVVGHSDIATTEGTPRRLGRKPDPGEEFNWENVEAAGLGLKARSGPSSPGLYGGFFERFTDEKLQLDDNDPRQIYGGVRRKDISNVITPLQTDLRAIGYFCPVTGVFDSPTQAAVMEFQRHFFSGKRPRAKTLGQVDEQTARLISMTRPERVVSVPLPLPEPQPIPPSEARLARLETMVEQLMSQLPSPVSPPSRTGSSQDDSATLSEQLQTFVMNAESVRDAKTSEKSSDY